MTRNRQQRPSTYKSPQEVQNWSFDEEFNVLAVENLVYNPASGALERMTDSIVYTEHIDTTTTPNIVYYGRADVGSTTSQAVWRIKRVDTTNGKFETWADGNADFDNVWDNRASLNYS